MAIKLRYPTRWLTYQQRIEADLDESFADPDVAKLFDQTYTDSLIAPIKQQEEWILKLFALQFAIMCFLVIGFTSPDTTLNFFGVALKNVAGIREVLLALSATVALLIMMLVSSRDTTVYLVQGICRRTVDPKFSDYAKFVLPGIFNFRLYIPRQHDRWVLATFVGKATTVIIALLTIFIALATIVASFAIHIFIIKEIWQHPTIGSWSYFALFYIGAAYVLNLLILFRRTLPFPYKDMGALKTTPPRQGK